MTRTSDFSRVCIKSSKKKVEYATTDYVLESLYLMKARDDLPVLELLDLLVDGKMDSVSFSRDFPHCYFYARTHADYVSMIIRRMDEGKEIEFQVPLKTLKLSLKDSDEDILRP